MERSQRTHDGSILGRTALRCAVYTALLSLAGSAAAQFVPPTIEPRPQYLSLQVSVLRTGSAAPVASLERDFAYYEPLTTHDSSLSPCVHGIVAARLGQVDKAVAYFGRTARMDLDDINRNVKDGVHTAAMGGTYLAVVAGFAGMRVQGGQLSFVPRLPASYEVKQLED